MKLFICESCGAEIKRNNTPEHCPLCSRKKFSVAKAPEPSIHDEEAKRKYDEALSILSKYDEGTSPRKMDDHTCCVSCDDCDDKCNNTCNNKDKN
ncbi:hypothetical protein K9L97_03330 [Candidatus Woesearchaeota archaeon]|nr:hypothetical protein [Candidatus Woesearchaeota archaeon]